MNLRKTIDSIGSIHALRARILQSLHGRTVAKGIQASTCAENCTILDICRIVNTGCTLPSARTFSATSPEKSSHLTAVVFHLWDDIL